MLNKLLGVNMLIIFLSSCQSLSAIGGSANTSSSTDIENQYKGGIASSMIDSIGRAFSGINAKSTIEDYIGYEDKQNIIKITRKAADTGKLQIFTNPNSGVQGKAEVVKSNMLPTQEEGKIDGMRECKTIRKSVVLKDKREITESVRTCKGPDGWS
ncbi:MAG: hypothetical protein O7D95_03260 [Betaproteobacteria bacterium]|nr:hypothetical protein [Betaproteobacteria bacterium]